MPRRKDLKQLKDSILDELAERSMRWSELWNQDRFGSTRYLQRCLRQLENQGLIKRVRISHKNVKYVVAANYEIWRQLKTRDERAEKGLMDLLLQIESIKDWPEERASRWFISVIASITVRFLAALEGTARATEEFKPIARDYLFERALDRWGRILVACGKAHGKATDNALSAMRGQLLKTMLDTQRASGTLPPKDMEVEELGLDIKKAADDFKRLILTVDS